MHDLVEEIKRRKYNHYSEVNKKWKFVEKVGFIDKENIDVILKE